MVDDLVCGPGGACVPWASVRHKRVRKRPHRRWPGSQRRPEPPEQLVSGTGAAMLPLPPPAVLAPAAATAQPAAPQPSPAAAAAAASGDSACGELSAAQLARVAVNTSVMLLVTDSAATSDMFHHWFGNVRAANISNWLVAAADDATSMHLVRLGLRERCYRLAGTQQRADSTGERGACGDDALVLTRAPTDASPQHAC